MDYMYRDEHKVAINGVSRPEAHNHWPDKCRKSWLLFNKNYNIINSCAFIVMDLPLKSTVSCDIGYLIQNYLQVVDTQLGIFSESVTRTEFQCSFCDNPLKKLVDLKTLFLIYALVYT